MSILSVSKTACIEALLLIQWAELVAEHQQEGTARFAHPILFKHFVCIQMSTKSDFPLFSNLVHILAIQAKSHLSRPRRILLPTKLHAILGAHVRKH